MRPLRFATIGLIVVLVLASVPSPNANAQQAIPLPLQQPMYSALQWQGLATISALAWQTAVYSTWAPQLLPYVPLN